MINNKTFFFSIFNLLYEILTSFFVNWIKYNNFAQRLFGLKK